MDPCVERHVVRQETCVLKSSGMLRLSWVVDGFGVPGGWRCFPDLILLLSEEQLC